MTETNWTKEDTAMAKHYHYAIDGRELSADEYKEVARRNMEIFNLPLAQFMERAHELRFICVTITKD